MESQALRRIAVALSSIAAVTVLGTIGYLLLGFSLLEALYQTVTTVTTVGFREVKPLSTTGTVFTIALVIVGVGTVLYSLGVILEALTEGHLREYLGRRRMDTTIDRMHGHVIICGHGRVGRAAREHLVATGQAVVVVDNDPARLADVGDAPYLVGDVTDDEVLRRAGIDRARALIATLDTDADTVYVTLSARAIRPDLVIVARARTRESKDKMVLAGATRAVNPQRIGGQRLAAFALQPDVAEFLDVVMHDENLDFRIQQVTVGEGSPLAGRRLADLDLQHRTGALLLAVRRGPETPFEPNPPDDRVLEPGAVLIALGTPEEIGVLAAMAGAPG